MIGAGKPLPAGAWTPAAEAEADGPMALARAVLATLWRHKLKLVLWTLLCFGAAYAYARTIPPSYTATASVLIAPSPAAGGIDGAPASVLLDSFRAESELEVIRSERLLATVFDRLEIAPPASGEASAGGAPATAAADLGRFAALLTGRPGAAPTPGTDGEAARQRAFLDFAGRLDVRRVGQSYVVEIAYTASDPTLARRVANAVVSAYLWQSVAAKASHAESGAEVLQGRVNALAQQADAALQAVARGELPAAAIPDADARVIGAALQPLSPSAPRKTLIVAFGAVLGALTGLLALTLAYAFDRSVRTPADLARATGLPCLAAIPAAPRQGGRAATESLDSPFAQAIRDLRTSLGTLAPQAHESGGRAIALVAWAPGTGCSFLARNLAGILRQGGRATTLIEADLAGAPAQPGAPSLSDALWEGTAPESLKLRDEEGLSILPAVSRDPLANYLADLSSPAAARLVAHARGRGETVIDLPPLSRSADARALAARADAVVLVAQAGRTTADDLAGAMRALAEVGVRPVGAVLNRA